MAAPEASSIPIPKLANYEIHEIIGQGGMGIVYQARQRNLDRIVALKVILAGELASEKEVRRFQLEAQAVARLRHPNIVTIHEVGNEAGHHFFSMEYVAGQSLAQCLKEMTPEQAARLLEKVARAVHYAHEQGILHRDLKPANILIDSRGEPRIMDFGLARQLKVESDLTVSGAIVGTPSYMAPEQAAGKSRAVNICSDVYSLGAILYEALTGRPPFRADSILETLRQVVEIPPAAPRLLNPKTPRDLEVICLKCLRKEPSQRYSSAAELGDDLGRYLRREPIEARPIAMLERNIAWCRRNPVPALALGVVALLFVLLAIAAFFFRQDSLQSNVAAAKLAARVITNYLAVASRPVAALARDPSFQTIVAMRKTNEIERALRAADSPLRESDQRFEVTGTWLVTAPDGDRIVRLPEMGSFTNRFGRDYFTGSVAAFTTSGAPRIYFSKIYKSKDDKFHKMAMSIVVPHPDDPQRVAGVLALMLKTDSTEEHRLGLGDPRQKTVVFGRWDGLDAEDRPDIQWIIWAHPRYRPNDPAVEVTRHLDFESRDRSWWHFDPAAPRYNDHPGPWLAGFAPVPGTSLVAVVQTRDWVGISFGVTVICTLMAAAGILALRAGRRRGLRQM